MFFNILINNFDSGMLSTFGNFAVDTKVSDTPYGYAAIQRDLARLETWAERNPIKFFWGKYKILPPGRKKNRAQAHTGDQ